MKILFKRSPLYRRLTLLSVATFIVVFSSVHSIAAQDISNPIRPKVGLPPALGKTQPLSPRNLQDYQKMVEEYAIAACLPITSGSGSVSGHNQQVTDLQNLLKKRDAALKTTLREKEARAETLQNEINQLDYQIKALTQLDGMKNQLDIANRRIVDLEQRSNENSRKLNAERRKRQTPAVKTLVEALEKLQESYDRDLAEARDRAEWLRGHIAGLEAVITVKDLAVLGDTLTNRKGRLDELKQLIVELKGEAAGIAGEMSTLTGTTCDSDRATRLRNNLIFIAISQSDVVFANYRLRRRSWTDNFDLLMDFLEIGLTTSAIITNGARAKSVLSSLSGLLKETHSAAQKDLKLKENQIYFNTMEAKRSTIFGQIMDHMKKPDDDYSYPMALMDVTRYVKAGTLDEAMSDLVTTTGSTKKDADAAAQKKKDLFFDKAPSPEQIAASTGNFKIIRSLREKLVAARDGGKDQQVTEITDTYTEIYNRVINDPVVKPAIEELVKRGSAFVAPPDDRNFTEKVKAKQPLTADEYDIFFTGVNGLVTTDEKFSKAGARFLAILADYKETK